MAANEIKIIIGGNTTGIQTAAKQTNAALNSISATANQANQALTKVTPGVNQATTALSNLGRVAQDAPFGFIGIQNNLNPLLESFQRLKAETGSTGAAFRALGSSLIGAGGLGLAVSAITSALTFFALGSRGAKEQLEGLAKAIDEANKKAGDEIARVQVLNAVITDNTRNQTERAAASKELSGILEDLNIKMTKEEILNGNVAKATKLATAAIIERAKARAIESRVAEISTANLEKELKLEKATKELADAQKFLNEQRKAGRQNIGGSTGGVGTGFGETVSAERNVSSLKDAVADLNKEIKNGNDEISSLIGKIKTNDLTVNLNGGTEKGKKDLDLLKQRIEALRQLQSLTGLTSTQQVELAQLEIQLAGRDAVKLGFTPAELQQQIEGILEKAFPVKTFEFEIEARPVIKLAEITPQIDVAGKTGNNQIEVQAPDFVFTNLKDKADEAKKRLQDAVNSIVTNVQVDGLAAIGEGIGEAIASGGNVFKGLFDVLATGLQQFGKALIAYGIALKGFKLAINTLNPVAAIAAGIGAIAAGTILKASLPKFADGGIATRATLGIFGEAGKEAIIPLDKLPQMMSKLNLATNSNVILQPSIRFSLTDFQLGLERVDNRRRRLG